MSENINTAGPLAGITVLDLSGTFMGPYSTHFLAQLGARVIKVEGPSGDIARYISDERKSGLGPAFMNANRTKESIVLDLKSDRDQDVLDKLIEGCDIFLHNMRPDACKRLNIEYGRISKINPRAVYVHLVGFATDGPYGGKAAYDDVIQASTGIASAQGGDAGPPRYVATTIVDKTMGVMAFGAMTAALFDRERTGLGQAVEVPMFETMAGYLMMEEQGGWVYESRPFGTGYPRTRSPYRKPYRTLDGYLGLLVYTDKHWRSFFEIIDRPELAEDERFGTIRGRTDNTDELYKLVEEAIATRTTQEWLDLLDAANISSTAVNSVRDLFDDPHLQATGFFERVSHPTEGELVQARLPWKYSKGALRPSQPAPALGQHTERILQEFGFTAGKSRSDALSSDGV